MHSEDEITNTYLRVGGAFSSAPGEYFWAFTDLCELVRDDVDAAWRIVRALIERASTDDLIGNVAAGPLEDLLYGGAGPRLIEEIAVIARTDRRFQRALRGVYLEKEDPVYTRLHELRAEFRVGNAE